MIILILLLLLTNLHLKLRSTQGTGADKLLSTQRVKVIVQVLCLPFCAKAWTTVIAPIIPAPLYGPISLCLIVSSCRTEKLHCCHGNLNCHHTVWSSTSFKSHIMIMTNKVNITQFYIINITCNMHVVFI